MALERLLTCMLMDKFPFHNFMYRNTQNGFTLIEMLISVTVFTVVVTIATGSLVQVLAASRKVQAQNIVIGNLDLALENIARNVRLGFNFHCGDSGNRLFPADCASVGLDFLSFTAFNGTRTAFRHFGTRIEKSTNCASTGCSGWASITAPEIVVESMLFYVDGTTAGDNRQPRVLVNVQGIAGSKAPETATFKVQTTITQRVVDS